MSFRVIGIGEVLWDLLPSGPQLGGAPANFAYHARQMGAQAQVITRVGHDVLGRDILRRLEEMGIRDGTIQADELLPTGTATVQLDGDGVPQFAISNEVAWDNIHPTDKALEATRQAQAICFGTLAQRSEISAATIRQIVNVASFATLRVFDINLRQKYYNREVVEQSLGIANVVKLNEQELLVLSGMFGWEGDTQQKILHLTRQFELQLVALTRGEKGSLLYQRGTWSDLPGARVKIVDTVGAGDAFTAALVMGLLNKFNLEDIHRIATDVAGFVCSRAGATPVLPEHLRGMFANHCTNA